MMLSLLTVLFASLARAEWGAVAWGRQTVDGKSYISTGVGRGPAEEDAVKDAIRNCENNAEVYTHCELGTSFTNRCWHIVKGRRLDGVAWGAWHETFQQALSKCQERAICPRNQEDVFICVEGPEINPPESPEDD